MRDRSMRVSPRHRVEEPVEAELHLCEGEVAAGWIIDEQDDGLGMAFGAEDARRLLGHADCCVGQGVDLRLESGDRQTGPIPVRLVHVTPGDRERVCRAGLALDVARMHSNDVAQLMAIWRTILPAAAEE